MARDQRWPYVWFLVMRSVQLLFGIITLGIAAYIVSLSSYWTAGMGVFIGLFVVIWMILNYVLFFIGLLLPVAVVVVDAFCVVFLLITMAGTAASGILSTSCRPYYSPYTQYSSWKRDLQKRATYHTSCLLAKAGFGMLFLSMCLFIVTLVYSSIVLHKTRKDLRGKKYSQGLPYTTAGDSDEQPQQQAGVMQFTPHPQPPAFEPNPHPEPQSSFAGGFYTQPPVPPSAYTAQPPYYPQQPVSPIYHSEPFPTHTGFVVSPPNSPPPTAVPGHYQGAHSYSHGIAEMSSINEPPVPQPQHPQQEQKQQQQQQQQQQRQWGNELSS